jgi:DNA modification methylase
MQFWVRLAFLYARQWRGPLISPILATMMSDSPETLPVASKSRDAARAGGLRAELSEASGDATGMAAKAKNPRKKDGSQKPASAPMAAPKDSQANVNTHAAQNHDSGVSVDVHAMGRGTFARASLPAVPVLAASAKVPACTYSTQKLVDTKAITARAWVGDCRDVLSKLPEVRLSKVDLVFADPPFNWNRAYDKWDDAMNDRDYLDFTRDWLDLCIVGLRSGGQIWVNIPDDWAAEIVMHLKARGLVMNNWCIWHYRFGQNTTARFINSKVHALNFMKPGNLQTWNPHEVLEISDRAAIYGDKRTLSKEDGMPPGKRVPMDVWYGPFMGRVQGNNKERRGYHDNQLPEAYLERVIRSTSKPGDLVLDPFLGSGTTGVMAYALGRHFIGTEFSAENAKRAFERIEHGPIRPLGDKAEMQSTAIFKKRVELQPEGAVKRAPQAGRKKAQR